MGFYETYRQKLLDIGVLTPQEAKAFFEDLFEISKRRLFEEIGSEYTLHFPTRQYKGPEGLSNCANGWRFGQPLGVCDHSTATESHRSILKWFSSYPKWKKGTGTYGTSNASSCFVISLSGEPFLLIDFWNGKSDWHEPILNGLTIGIEHVNCGELRTEDGKTFYWWPSGWGARYPYTNTLPPQSVSFRMVSWMQPYTKAQLLTNLIIKRAFLCLYSKAPEWLLPRPELFIDHATRRDDMVDQGPLWPLAELRTAAFSFEPIKNTKFFSDAEDEDTIAHLTIDSLGPQILHTSMFKGRMPMNLHKTVIDTEYFQAIQYALKRFGYTTATDGNQLDTLYVKALRKFQADNNLIVDGVANPATRSIILNKLVEKDKSLS